MTLFESIVAFNILWVTLFLIGYFVSGNPWSLFVAVACPVYWFVFLQAMKACSRLQDWWRPFPPVCRRRRCDHRLYRYKRDDPLYDGVVHKCNCHDKYVYEERRFMQLLSDGTLRPYLKHTRFGRWQPDEP